MTTDLIESLLAEMSRMGSSDMIPRKVEPGEVTSLGLYLPFIGYNLASRQDYH
jgi:hypothetical protein